VSKTYYRTSEMCSGGPFKCHNCGKLLIKNISGSEYELDLYCPRCRAEIKIVVKEPVPISPFEKEEAIT